MIYLVDNYDSFSYNLVQLVGDIAGEIEVIRNDAMSTAELLARHPSGIILSPGPGRPADAGICEQVALEAHDVPILGVCLGHQAICEAFGATIGYAKQLMHGKSSVVEADQDCPLFTGLPPAFEVARYHSLAVDDATLPACLRITARTQDGEVMAVQHVERPIFGVQFHPESILTPDGRMMLENFMSVVEAQA